LIGENFFQAQGICAEEREKQSCLLWKKGGKRSATSKRRNCVCGCKRTPRGNGTGGEGKGGGDRNFKRIIISDPPPDGKKSECERREWSLNSS